MEIERWLVQINVPSRSFTFESYGLLVKVTSVWYGSVQSICCAPYYFLGTSSYKITCGEVSKKKGLPSSELASNISVSLPFIRPIFYTVFFSSVINLVRKQSPLMTALMLNLYKEHCYKWFGLSRKFFKQPRGYLWLEILQAMLLFADSFIQADWSSRHHIH